MSGLAPHTSNAKSDDSEDDENNVDELPKKNPEMQQQFVPPKPWARPQRADVLMVVACARCIRLECGCYLQVNGKKACYECSKRKLCCLTPEEAEAVGTKKRKGKKWPVSTKMVVNNDDDEHLRGKKWPISNTGEDGGEQSTTQKRAKAT